MRRRRNIGTKIELGYKKTTKIKIRALNFA